MCSRLRWARCAVDRAGAGGEEVGLHPFPKGPSLAAVWQEVQTQVLVREHTRAGVRFTTRWPTSTGFSHPGQVTDTQLDRRQDRALPEQNALHSADSSPQGSLCRISFWRLERTFSLAKDKPLLELIQALLNFFLDEISKRKLHSQQ